MIKQMQPEAPNKQEHPIFRKLALLLLGVSIAYLAYVILNNYFPQNSDQAIAAPLLYEVCEFGGEAFRGSDEKHLLPLQLFTPLRDGEVLYLKEDTRLILRHTSGAEILFEQPCLMKLLKNSIEILDGSNPTLLKPSSAFQLKLKTE